MLSILDGGFIAAARYLQRADSSFTLNGALVDVNVSVLQSILNVDSEPLDAAPTEKAKSGNPTIASRLESVGGGGLATSMTSFLSHGFSTSSSSSSGAPAEDSPPVNENPSKVAPESTGPTFTGKDISDNLNATAAAAKQIFSGFGKKFELFSTASIETLKKSVASVVAAPDGSSRAAAEVGTGKDSAGASPPSSFVIDEDDEDDGMGPKEIPDSKRITINKTDFERAHALALHKMAGMKKGDTLIISRKELPGYAMLLSLSLSRGQSRS